jgi:gamma-glutamyltranspeptidase/glutathione hydrolase
MKREKTLSLPIWPRDAARPVLRAGDSMLVTGRLLLAFTLLLASWDCPVSGQQQVVAEKFAVASGHPAATAAGLDVLRRGGNVIDAAVATSLALGVAEPYGSGLGGKLVMLFRDAETSQVHAVEALCAAPGEIDPQEFAQLSRNQRHYGWQAVCVPGLPAGLYAAHERWGSLSWEELVEPAATLAEEGVQIDATMRSMFAPKAEQLAKDAEAAALFLVEGKTPPLGAVLKNADLAETLRALGRRGAEAFYEGQTARLLVNAARENGWDMTLEDFQEYQPRFTQPLQLDYRDVHISSCPQPLTGGATVVATLKALESHDFTRLSPRGTKEIDAVNRALLSVYPRVTRTVADVASAVTGTPALWANDTMNEVRAEAAKFEPADPYDRAAQSEPVAVGAAEDDASTSHLTVADAKGNIVCLTQSLSYHFGACVVAPGTGFPLNNSMSNFGTSSPRSVNYVAGGKRPRSTIAPVIVTREGQPVLALGIPGGQRIPTTTIQLLIDVLDRRAPLAEAFDRPRYHLQRPVTRRGAANMIDLEEGIPDEVTSELEALGWRTRFRRRTGHYFGGGNAIAYTADGKLIAVADPRRTNHAAGD